ncbi:hypothetical protein AB0G79_20170 [Streptomyces sp. NPDC020807]|uniref:hypothetical protein n=1 Tax=Streptomyces sp. NPDC020807 TaxID=3155119 RepID=UPI0033DE2F48
MDSAVLAALIGAGAGVTTSLLGGWLVLVAARRTAAAAVEGALAQARATRSAGAEAAYAQIDGAYVMERRAEQRAAYEELLTLTLDYLDGAWAVIQSIRVNNIHRVLVRIRSLLSPDNHGDQSVQETIPAEPPSINDLRRVVARLAVIGGIR